ncbi:glutathionylspermidine synthase family protein [Brevibacillus dissolubilis]|uniref:glutathionylspermidine synthase family protein n=1 Tax=Brevibacillus dissolubilis TaxID=1844116 RepID=UPI0011179AD8|nr:glutathionylspermidine synthase family protein [Brevibacillus dissolubilis]
MVQEVLTGVKLVTLDAPHDEVYAPTRDWCSWDRMYGKEYLVPALTVFSRERVRQIAQVTEQLYRLYQKTLRFVQANVPDEFLVHQLGILEPLCAIIRQTVPVDGITRFDFALTEDGIYLLEYNSDTPTGVVETAYVADSVIRRYTSYANPSAQMNQEIKRALGECVAFYQKHEFEQKLIYSGTRYSDEDAGTVTYAREQAGLDSLYVPLEEMSISEHGLSGGGERAGIWYRLYPWEHLPHDKDESGFPIGLLLIQQIAEGKVATISPPQSIITQSKGLQALIYDLAELGHPLYTAEDQELIRKHFLVSRFEPDEFVEKGVPYVSKPFFGREGGAVTLYDAQGQVEERDGAPNYWDQQMLYQQRVDLPSVRLRTEEGETEGYLLLGAFCIGGRFAGLLPRIGGKITGNLSYFTPAAMEELE